ncbi:hypothetical protein [Rhizobium sp. BK176]|uniref:hypothetical protein n=1 Tax=Rhizobium sp. BK176 TaxID=2587071 RepID=UPI0021694524|nr:hypothetical protein [Rhizobium sp. BK176]MCS4088551.1 hypothetical protein [Rhizobium sp. BK176]
MPAFFVNQQSVKSLAKSVRAAFGSDVKHMRVLKIICAALGWQPDALLNKLNRYALDGRDPEPAIIAPNGFASRLASSLGAEYGKPISANDVEALISGVPRDHMVPSGSQIVEAGTGDVAFFHLLFLLEYDREMRTPRPLAGLDPDNPHHQLAAALASIERGDNQWGPSLHKAFSRTPKLLIDLLRLGFPIFGEMGQMSETSKVGMSWIAKRMGFEFDLGLSPHEAHVVNSVMGPTLSADTLRSMAIGELRRVDLKGRAFRLVEELAILPTDITDVAKIRKDMPADRYLEFFGEEKPDLDRKSRLAGLAERKIAQAKAQGLMR